MHGLAAVRPIFLPVLRICLSHSYCFGTLVLSRNGCQAFGEPSYGWTRGPVNSPMGREIWRLITFFQHLASSRRPVKRFKENAGEANLGSGDGDLICQSGAHPLRSGDEMQLVPFFFPFRCLNGFRFGQPKPLICRYFRSRP